MQGQNAIAVAVIGGDAFPCSPVPDFDGVVEATADELSVVELEAADAACVAAEGAQLFSSVDVPDLDGHVVGAAGEDVVVELKAHYAVGVAFEDFGGATAVFPVRTDFEPIFVDVFPGSETRLEV